MQLQEVKSFLEDTQIFFVQYHQFLEARVDELIEAKCDSRSLSQWLAIVARENIDEVMLKLKKYESSLEEIEQSTGIWTNVKKAYGLLTARTTTSTKDSRIDAITLNAHYKKIVAKTHNHLLRAKESINKIKSNSKISALFIPVEEYLNQDRLAREVASSCKKVIFAHQATINQTITKVNKTWFPLALNRGLLFVAIRINAFGLMKVSPFNVELSALEIERNNKKARIQLEEMVNRINQINTNLQQPTKITKKILGIDYPSDNPSNPLHYQYFPEDLEMPLQAFTELMKKSKPQGEEVLEAVRVVFPKQRG